MRAMADHVYEKIEVVGSSPVSIEEAIKNAVAMVADTHKTLRWLEVVETRAQIDNNRVAHWQVTVKIGARAE
jgi:flavin-binding protein dodecin